MNTQTSENTIRVHSVEPKNNTIYFVSDAETFADQRVALMAPDADAICVSKAREELKMNDPGISDRIIKVIDTTTNQIARPKPNEVNDGKYRPILQIKFESF